MPVAKTKVVYVLDNKGFDSTKELVDYVDNKIGENVLDVINKKCEIRHKEFLHLLNILTRNKDVRETLVRYLNIKVLAPKDTFSYDEEDFVETNIFELH